MTLCATVLIMAAGLSERLGLSLPKPYVDMGGMSLLRRTVLTFLNHPAIEGVRVVIRREHHALYKQAVEGLTLYPCVIGGNSRQESVRLGLESLTHRAPAKVLIHDVARPFQSAMLINNIVARLQNVPAAIPALPVADTLKRADAQGHIATTIPREGLFRAQTPQGFDYALILAAHQRFKDVPCTDDAMLAEMAGIPVNLIAGETDNFKITTREDLNRMQTILDQKLETRTGFGFDVHPLKPHDPETPVARQHVKICGVRIPHTHYLEGHSDADVGLHALVDAVLGAIGAGDIGMHFPPDDRKWAGADSSRFLLHAYEMLRSQGGEIVNLDITIIAQEPKIAPHRADMAGHIATLLKLPQDRVNIKATTTERLGALGRGEGIAAQAVATVKVPA